jgi:hypothetical protein
LKWFYHRQSTITWFAHKGQKTHQKLLRFGIGLLKREIKPKLGIKDHHKKSGGYKIVDVMKPLKSFLKLI